MSNYPTWWDNTVTIYNKYTDTTTKVVKWYRHVVDNCFWKNVGSKVMVGNVLLDTESITCRIPKQSDFVEAHKWVAIPNDQKGNYFTLQPDDIIIVGEVTDEINEYVKGERATDIISKYRLQGCITVKDVAIDTMTGLNSPHYRVRGL